MIERFSPMEQLCSRRSPALSSTIRPYGTINGMKMSSPVPGITLSTHRVNNSTYRIASAGPMAGPLVLFLHGWPESWFAWRHQMQALSKEGYRCVAPDMKGYGGTDAPQDTKEYSITEIRDDMVALVHHLGYQACFLVGHDWGAWTTW